MGWSLTKGTALNDCLGKTLLGWNLKEGTALSSVLIVLTHTG